MGLKYYFSRMSFIAALIGFFTGGNKWHRKKAIEKIVKAAEEKKLTSKKQASKKDKK